MINSPDLTDYYKTIPQINQFINFLYFDFYGERKYYGLFNVLCFKQDCEIKTFLDFLENETLWLEYKKHNKIRENEMKDIKFSIIQSAIRMYLGDKTQELCKQ